MFTGPALGDLLDGARREYGDQFPAGESDGWKALDAFMRERLVNGARTRFVAAEPTSCPTLTKGLYAYDFGDTAGLTPLVKMYTLGHGFVPPGIHAGGLRYHGMAPIVSFGVKLGRPLGSFVKLGSLTLGAKLNGSISAGTRPPSRLKPPRSTAALATWWISA